MKRPYLGALRGRVGTVVFVLILSIFAIGVAVTIAQSNPQLPPEKQALLDKSEADRATAVANRKPGLLATGVAQATEVAVKLQTPQPTSTIVTGIRDIQLSPFHSEEALVENQWQGFVAGQLVRVYAGRLTADPEQGFIAVEKMRSDDKGYLAQTAPTAISLATDGTPVVIAGLPSYTLQKYLTPSKEGAVSIVSVNGLQLTLASKNGKTFTFDLTALAFK